MAGFDDLVAKGRQAYEDHKEQVDGALHSQQAEQISDTALDSVVGFAKRVTPDGADAKIDELRGEADKHVGNQ